MPILQRIGHQHGLAEQDFAPVIHICLSSKADDTHETFTTLLQH